METFYQEMIEASFLQTGNTRRIQKVMKKAAQGEEVTIGYIGGSITEGACATTYEKNYAYLSCKWFRDTYGNGDNVHLINVGMGGTTSTLGAMRYERDLWYQGYTTEKKLPDIVFIEYAVNDGDDPTMGEAYESLIRTVLQAENQPAVLLLFCVFESEFNLQERLIPLGKHYDLPMISIKNALIPRIKSGEIENRQFFANDGWHPLDYGHQIIADCIAYCYQKIQQTSSPEYHMPQNIVIGNAYENMHMIDTASKKEGIRVEAASFGAQDPTTGMFPYTNRPKMGDNWKHAKEAGNESFTMQLTCKSLILAYKLANHPDAGKIEIQLDGKTITPLICTSFCKAEQVPSLSSFSQGGWNNPWMAVLLSDKKAKEHTIEIRMAKGEEEKEFTLLGFGYSE